MVILGIKGSKSGSRP